MLPVWAVVLGLLALAIARVVALDDTHLLMLVDAYTLWVFLPAYAIAVAAWCFRAWPLAAVATVVVIAHLAWVVPPLTHTVPVTAADRAAPRVRVVTANLRFTNTEHTAMIDALTRFHADVLVMEEVTHAWWNAIARSRLRASHPYVARHIEDDPGGMAVLSRLPLRDVVVHRAGGWPIIAATVDVGHRAVHLVGVHVVAPLETFARNERARAEVNRIVRSTARPRLVLGDFNSTPYNEWHHQLLGFGLRDAHESVGRALATTWQDEHSLPPLLLDHVYADRSIVPLRVAEGTGPGSDHRPVVADLAVLPRSRPRD